MTEHHDYMNDPRMEEFRHLTYPAQEVRAWRLAVQDRTEGMTSEQKKTRDEAMRREREAFCEKHGIKLKYAESAVTA